MSPGAPATDMSNLNLSVSTDTALLRFAVTADTKYGESIVLCGDAPALGAFSLSSAVPMSYEQPGVWQAEVAIPRSESPVRYKYAVKATDGTTVTYEPGAARVLQTNIAALEGDYLVRDAMRSSPDVSKEIFGTAAFAEVVFRRPLKARKAAKVAAAEDAAQVSKALILGKGAYVARFSVFCERVRVEDEVVLLGIGEDGPIAMTDTDSPEWTVAVAMPSTAHRLQYQFAIRNKGTREICVTETVERVVEFNHEDRMYLERNFGAVAVVFLMSERSFAYPSRWRGSGIAIPVFSLRSKLSCGVGEFNDLNAMVDLCVATGNQLLQLLPINDTTSFNSWRDSYPYSAVSSFALHPQYLNIDSLGSMPSEIAAEYSKERESLNSLPEIHYERMMEVKNRYIRKMYSLHKAEALKSREFQDWFKENQAWLVPYALFRFLMDVNGSSNYDNWGARKVMTRAEMEEMAKPDSFHFDYIGLTYYTQFHLHKQLSAASDYAAKNQVVFKGDLPIGVNRHCVDTWVNPHLFRLEMQAGAPPDFFSKNGQNWFFPTYDWEAMNKDNYGWWRARLGQMAKYFNAYRIDHILGFFRIWEIPARFQTGMSGRMFPAHAISRSELESRGLWDVQRLTMPYVRDKSLEDLLHDDWWKVKDRFFEHMYEDRLKFKEEFNTERKCAAALELPADATEEEIKKNEKVKQALFTLHNNVCLLEDEAEPGTFHPRFMMHETASYHELPSAEWKTSLYDLYEDYFFHRQEELWRKSGLEKLPMMKSASNMLVCGEDLGFVPTSVPAVMKETCIVSLKVQRMPDGDGLYGVPSEYPYESVATTSSHDTSTFRGWWEEIPADDRQNYWSNLMQRSGAAPAECSGEIAEWAVNDHLQCPAMWTVFPLQDLLAMDESIRRKVAAEETINDPSNSMHIWNFRLHIPIEDVLAKKDLVEKLEALNLDAGRGVAY